MSDQTSYLGQALRRRAFLVSAWPWRALLYLTTTVPVAGLLAFGLLVIAAPMLAAVGAVRQGRPVELPPVLCLAVASGRRQAHRQHHGQAGPAAQRRHQPKGARRAHLPARPPRVTRVLAGGRHVESVRKEALGMAEHTARQAVRPHEPDDGWLAAVAQAAGHDAGGVPVELLGEYLPMLADAAVHGRRPRRRELEAVELLGRRAAEQGVSAGRVVQLYLSAARRMWQDLPTVVRSQDSEAVRSAATAVLQVVDEAVATLAEGYAVARRDLVRREEAARRELVDDLLRGDSDLGAVVKRAEPFGLDVARAHRVALAAPSTRLPDAEAAIGALEAVMFDRLGDRDVLVATKDGLLVVLAPAGRKGADDGGAADNADDDLGRLMHHELSRLRHGRPWRIAVGRSHPGLYGIARSYEEAREALGMATRLQVEKPVVGADELLIFRVLLRDQAAMVDLVHAVLSPLTRARGGAQPLLSTLDAYFEAGAVATASAKRLHVSVRTVTYRLDRVRALTGYDPADPVQRFTLQAAVLGAKALNWPQQPLPDPS